MITVACCLWDANDKSHSFSRHYTEADADKLYRGFARNLTAPWRMVCFTDRLRRFDENIEQEMLSAAEPDYGSLIEPFRLNEPAIICGLDTIVTGNCDALADYCLAGNELAAPRDPYAPQQACNGVVLAPGGLKERMWDAFDGRNDMEWVRANPHHFIDDIFPGACVSYKGCVAHFGLEDARIVFFHGEQKPHELQRLDWVREHWR